MLTSSSPSTSPTLLANDNTSRKRQRSLSMQSESEASSSSPKRSMSQDPSTIDGLHAGQSQDVSSLSLTDPTQDADIDAYMADQGEDGIPKALEPPPSTSINGFPAADLSPSKKLETIEALQKSQMVAGETWYLVSRRWYKRWQKACSGEVDKEGAVEEKDLGPVDNSALVLNGNLISTAMEHVDVEFFPEKAWSLLVSWYGTPQYSLPRKVITRGISAEASLELFPPVLKGHLLSATGGDDLEDYPVYVTVSTKSPLRDVHKCLVQATCKSDDITTRVWKLADGNAWTQLHFPLSQLKERGATLIEQSDKIVEDALIENGDAFVIEVQQDGKWIVDRDLIHSASGTSTPQSTAPQAPKPLFGSSPDFFSQLQAKAATPTAGPNKANASTSTTLKPSPSIKPNAVSSRAKGIKVTPGTLGLGNMGNTCFMNSAIQCLAHTKELTDYFLTGVFVDELNPDNPLGMHGQIAEAFGALLRRIWDSNSSNTSYSPREFKQILQRFAPQFGGYQQHDSQELVAFLLDGLHEDLNRVLKKPYVEKPDWEGGGNKELVSLAQESWEGYMKRNDSVIVDLFQGQYQSTLVCPECEKVSITFDPFMYLTLPLPIQKKWAHSIYYVPWDLGKPHVKVPIELNRDASFREVRQVLGRWMGSDPDHLVTLEIYNNRFYKNLDDHTVWGDMSESDTIVCFELPCHSRQSRNYKKDENGPFIVPVFLCDTIRQRTSYASTPSTLFGYPFIVVIDEQQACSKQAMYEAVVERLERWTANSRDLFQWEAGSISEPMEEVNIPIASGPSVESVTEIKENGDVVTVQVEVIPEEGDIADEKSIVVQEQEDESMDPADDVPRKVGIKKDLFTLHVQPGSQQYGIGYASFGASTQRFDKWLNREAEADREDPPVLLKDNDAFFCEFDENVRMYYFGSSLDHWEHARWETWEEFLHPEYTASRNAAAAKKNKLITLQDCLDEFTKEEKLGEDDLWYCPQCKKHQQATKRFDLWKVPDVLVVHLKRFSNSRTLRDKIDTFVDFPLQGLDLTDMVGERQVAKKLAMENVNIDELGLDHIDEPLVYDLFAVDEHLGGLGGGHYRAYAYNHVSDQWYHFDDSYVSTAKPHDAVNANAYLLFYRRRTSRPLGGKSHVKVEEARSKRASPSPSAGAEVDESLVQTELEKPESSAVSIPVHFHNRSLDELGPSASSSSDTSSTPPPLEDADPPTFEASLDDEILQSSLDPLDISANQFDFPNPLSRLSPSSSVEAEPDQSARETPEEWTPNQSGRQSPEESEYIINDDLPLPNPRQSIILRAAKFGNDFDDIENETDQLVDEEELLDSPPSRLMTSDDESLSDNDVHSRKSSI